MPNTLELFHRICHLFFPVRPAAAAAVALIHRRIKKKKKVKCRAGETGARHSVAGAITFMARGFLQTATVHKRVPCLSTSVRVDFIK